MNLLDRFLIWTHFEKDGKCLAHKGELPNYPCYEVRALRRRIEAGK